jgi:type I site-specific restriction-modification system R (restriction) subunit
MWLSRERNFHGAMCIKPNCDGYPIYSNEEIKKKEKKTIIIDGKYVLEGVPVAYKKNNENRTFTVKLIDFDNPSLNDFKVVNQYTIIEYKTKRPDIIIFINGIPMILFELKNMVNSKEDSRAGIIEIGKQPIGSTNYTRLTDFSDVK